MHQAQALSAEQYYSQTATCWKSAVPDHHFNAFWLCVAWGGMGLNPSNNTYTQCAVAGKLHCSAEQLLYYLNVYMVAFPGLSSATYKNKSHPPIDRGRGQRDTTPPSQRQRWGACSTDVPAGTVSHPARNFAHGKRILHVAHSVSDAVHHLLVNPSPAGTPGAACRTVLRRRPQN